MINVIIDGIFHPQPPWLTHGPMDLSQKEKGYFLSHILFRLHVEVSCLLHEMFCSYILCHAIITAFRSCCLVSCGPHIATLCRQFSPQETVAHAPACLRDSLTTFCNAKENKSCALCIFLGRLLHSFWVTVNIMKNFFLILHTMAAPVFSIYPTEYFSFCVFEEQCQLGNSRWCGSCVLQLCNFI